MVHQPGPATGIAQTWFRAHGLLWSTLGWTVPGPWPASLDSDEPAILPDDYGGGQISARHFLAAGRRTVESLSPPRKAGGGGSAAQATAAIDDNALAGDEAGLFGSQETHRVGDVGGGSHPPGGH
jgi:hypothetical protein